MSFPSPFGLSLSKPCVESRTGFRESFIAVKICSTFIRSPIHMRFPEEFDAQIKLQRPDQAAGFAAYITLKLMSFALVLTDELPLQKEHCCAAMTEQANLTYLKAKSALLGSTDKRIYWSPLFDEYGLICQPSAEVLVIAHCPFCGVQLPLTKRALWFEKLERSGWQTWGDPIPKEFFTEAWREL